MSQSVAFVWSERFGVRRRRLAGPLLVAGLAGTVLASCGDRPGGGGGHGGVEQVARTVTASASFTPTFGTAFAHAVTARLSDPTLFPVCSDNTQVTPPPNGTRPPGPFGPGLTPPLVDFEGTNGSQSCRCFNSNDASGAIGPDNYVQTTNCAVTVYDRAGNRLAGPVSTAALWSDPALAGPCTGSSAKDAAPVSDASVAYDRVADRWVITRFGHDFTTTNDDWNECFAVSQTGDPTGPYNVYGFFIDSPFVNDYPKLGLWPDAYYVTTLDNFIDSGLGDFITAFDRQKMIDGDPTPGVVQFFLPGPTPATPPPQGRVHIATLPAFADGPTMPPPGTPDYVVGLEDDDFGFPADRLQVYEFHVDWTNPAASTFTPTTSVVPTPFHSSVCSPTSGPYQDFCLSQPPPTTVPGPVPGLFSVSAGNMMQRLAYRVFPDHQSLLFNYTIAAPDDAPPANVHSAIRWTELRRQGGDWSLAQEGTYAPDAHNRWLGTMAMDKDGDIALGFVAASSTLPVSVRYTGQSAGAPPGTLAAEQTLVPGGGTLVGDGNLGDYATMSIDPQDDCTFWLVNTYVAGDTQLIPNVQAAEWHTRIGSFKFGSCNNPPVARCRNVAVAANGSCQGTTTANNVDNGSSDVDGDPLTCTLAPAGPFSLGATPVTLTCADPSGATGSCTATVTVTDETPPTLTPPPNKTVSICAESAVVAVGTATASDNCAHPVSVSGRVIAANGVALTPPLPVVNGQVTLKAGTYTIRWTASDGTNTVTATQTVVVGGGIQAGQSFLVDDRGQVQNAAGGFGAVLNSGTGATRVGQDTRSGAILSRGAVTIQHRAIVNGDVVSASTVTRDSDATVTGTITQFGSVVLPPAPTVPAFPPATLGGFAVNSGGTQARPPGSYTTAALNGGTLILSAGDYFFQSLTINSGSTLRATPTTRIFVRDALVFGAPVLATSGTALQAITLGFAGTTLGMFAPFNGTLIAPNAAVTFGTGAGLTYRGSFFGRTLEVTPASVLVCTPS